MRLPQANCPLPHRRTDLYGAFAFGSVIVTCFLQFAVARRINGEVWQVAATFLLGALYGALGIFGDAITLRYGPRWRLRNFFAMTAIVTVMLYVSPLRGFFGIIALPLVSQAIFDFTPLRAVLASLYLFTASVGVFWFHFGYRTVPEAVISYLAAFAFTAAFTFVTRKALDARERSETLSRELEAANEKLRAYAAQAGELATTRERNRLAREIHDGVGHYLTVVKTQLDVAAAVCASDPAQAKANIEKAARLTADALDDVRRSVGTLRTDAARPPLPVALQQLAVHGEPVPAVAIEGTPRQLPPAAEHALFRAAQEGLTNIRKHAQATNALLQLDFRDTTRVRLEISDNGRGAAEGSGQAGFGLTGLRERVELLGGKVESGNRLEGGFALRVEVPA
ncbi:MAG: two-component sensor histidine kinase [Opitutus sp.]|nr:two-component sensor histidine kinase [Opitutus sp.]